MSKPIPALKAHYDQKVVSHLKEKLGLKNVCEVPRIEKIVVNCSVGSQADATFLPSPVRSQ
jgi:large subunit ribosomal protein L5